MTEKIISYPEVHKIPGRGFNLTLELPNGYDELVKIITPEIEGRFREKFLEIQRRFGLKTHKDYYPITNWRDRERENRLTRIQIGNDCACIQLTDREVSLCNIDTALEAFTATQMVCYYLNTLQILQN